MYCRVHGAARAAAVQRRRCHRAGRSMAAYDRILLHDIRCRRAHAQGSRRDVLLHGQVSCRRAALCLSRHFGAFVERFQHRAQDARYVRLLANATRHMDRNEAGGVTSPES
eukprot:942547-Prymnesium_polylepis.1